MDDLQLEQHQLDNMAKKCMSARETIASEMVTLLNKIQSLAGFGLVGATNVALQDVSGQLNQGLTTILNALDELAGKISQASVDYGLHDDDAAATIRQAGDVGGDPFITNILLGNGGAR